jgi:hypothetical protein
MINIALRKDMTAKVEGMCDKYDEEVRNHEEFVFLFNQNFYLE